MILPQENDLIEVTDDDIRCGRRRSIICCPIALALKRKYGRTVAVHSGFAPFYYCHDMKPKSKVHRLPEVANEFISEFDVHAAFKAEPFSFQLGPDWSDC